MGEEYGDSAEVDEGMFRYRFWYCNEDVEDVEDDLDIDIAHLDRPDVLDSSSKSPYIRLRIAWVIFWKSIVNTSAH
jgi:hypothetical protein